MSVPIEEARNIGPKCGIELTSLGIDTLEKLCDMGWEEAFDLWVAHYPERIHAMACYALIGAVEDINCLKLSEDLKRAAKSQVRLARENRLK